MPDKQTHLNRKDTNILARAYLQAANRFYDWEITMLFYAALHYVDAFFSETTNPRERHPDKHGFRRRLVERYMAPIAIEYVLLNKLSENARYESFIPQSSDLQKAEGYYQKISNFLQGSVAP